MIEREVYDDALNATEELLLVPVPVNSLKVEDGFAKQILDAYPDAKRQYEEAFGIVEGDYLLVDVLESATRTIVPYTLVFAAIHSRAEEAWTRSPELLNDVLDSLHHKFGATTLATAGIPGNGFNGLKGDAPIVQIEHTLDQSPLRVSVYKRGYAGDREGLEYAQPPLVDNIELDIPVDSIRLGV